MSSLINPDKAAALGESVKTTFQNRLNNMPELAIEPLVMRTDSDDIKEEYGWLQTYVHTHEWNGQREYGSEEVFDYFIRNRTFANGFKTKIEDIQDGRYAMKTKTRAQDMADSYQRRVNQELVQLLDKGFSQTGIDGKNFFATDHPHGRFEFDRDNNEYTFKQNGTFQNIIEDSGGTNNPALTEDNLWQAWEDFAELKTINGEPASEAPTHLIVGPRNYRTALQILDRSNKAESNASVENETEGIVDIILVRRLGTSENWYLADLSQTRKPLIFQNRVSPQMHSTVGSGEGLFPDALQGEVDNTLFEEGAVKHGTWGRFGVGYGPPELMMGSNVDG